MEESVTRELIAAAAAARQGAYVPYSKFPVGAALLAADGRVFTGCNVENASYSLTICAERNAVFHAVSQGARKFVAIAVVTENGVTPCGACRQVLAEFNPRMTVIVSDTSGHMRTYALDYLLGDAFIPTDLDESTND